MSSNYDGWILNDTMSAMCPDCDEIVKIQTEDVSYLLDAIDKHKCEETDF